MGHVFLPGVRKSGTTFLYHLLNQHPEICMSEPKEPLFFEAEYEKGLEYYRRTYFSNCDDARITGEACSRLLMLPFVPERVHACFPDARFVVSLRDPVTRAYSHWWGNYANSVDPLSFEDALRKNRERLNRDVHFQGNGGKEKWRKNALKRERKELLFRYYLDMGYYAQHLKNWFDVFDRESFCILIFEEFVQRPEKAIRRIWDDLGVSTDVEVESTRPKMVGPGNVGSILGSVGTRMNVSERLPESLKDWIGYGLSLIGDERPEMSSETRDWLRDHYRPHILELDTMIDRDLSQWLDSPSTKRE